MNKKKKNYYQKNYYNKKNKKNKSQESNSSKKKVTYDLLLKANTVSEITQEEKDDYSKIQIIKYIAITVVLFAIIFGSILLFSQM